MLVSEISRQIRTGTLVPGAACLLFCCPGALAENTGQFTRQFTAISYPVLNSFSGPVEMNWDFSRGKHYHYSVTDNSFTVKKTRGFPGTGVQLSSVRISGTGQLTLSSNFDRTARLSMQTEMTNDAVLPDGRQKSGTYRKPLHVIENFSRNGLFVPKRNNDYTVMNWMRLPENPVHPGDTLGYTIQQPIYIDTPERDLMLTGELKLTHAGYASCGESRCSEIHGEALIIDSIADQDMGTDFTIHYSVTTKTWFDIDNGKLFDYVNVATIRIDAEIPGTHTQGMKDDAHIVMETDSFTRVRYNPEKPGKLTIKKYHRKQNNDN
ncbi:MAG: hypothetical protein MI673_04250 [Thiotrichales bacterium]|nr:hypothetical protein [Thiotrichales bacterium]